MKIKVKFNASFTVDSKVYSPGEQEVEQSVFEIASKLDVAGLPLIDKVNQSPLCVKIEGSNEKSKVQG